MGDRKLPRSGILGQKKRFETSYGRSQQRGFGILQQKYGGEKSKNLCKLGSEERLWGIRRNDVEKVDDGSRQFWIHGVIAVRLLKKGEKSGKVSCWRRSRVLFLESRLDGLKYNDSLQAKVVSVRLKIEDAGSEKVK